MESNLQTALPKNNIKAAISAATRGNSFPIPSIFCHKTGEALESVQQPTDDTFASIVAKPMCSQTALSEVKAAADTVHTDMREEKCGRKERKGMMDDASVSWYFPEYKRRQLLDVRSQTKAGINSSSPRSFGGDFEYGMIDYSTLGVSGIEYLEAANLANDHNFPYPCYQYQPAYCAGGNSNFYYGNYAYECARRLEAMRGSAYEETFKISSTAFPARDGLQQSSEFARLRVYDPPTYYPSVSVGHQDWELSLALQIPVHEINNTDVSSANLVGGHAEPPSKTKKNIQYSAPVSRPVSAAVSAADSAPVSASVSTSVSAPISAPVSAPVALTTNHPISSNGILTDRAKATHSPMYLSRSRNGIGSQKETRRRCKICRTRIAMMCKECDVALCFALSTSEVSCWEKYHVHDV